jgi:hypothetical protein
MNLNHFNSVSGSISQTEGRSGFQRWKLLIRTMGYAMRPRQSPWQQSKQGAEGFWAEMTRCIGAAGSCCSCDSTLAPLALGLTSSIFQRRLCSFGAAVIHWHTMQMRAFTASPTVSRPCTRINDGSPRRQRRAGQLQRRTVTTQANILEDAINTYALTSMPPEMR